MAEEKLVGKISHYYDKIGVGIIGLSGFLKAGDIIRVKGKETDFEQTVDSIQIDHAPVEKAENGDVVGIKMHHKVRDGDEVFLK